LLIRGENQVPFPSQIEQQNFSCSSNDELTSTDCGSGEAEDEEKALKALLQLHNSTVQAHASIKASNQRLYVAV
jgi:hypothetical protein